MNFLKLLSTTKKDAPSPVFPAVKQGWQLTRYWRMRNWDAVQSRIVVNMPIIHIRVKKIACALHKL